MDTTRQSCCCHLPSRSLTICSPELHCRTVHFAGGASCHILVSLAPGSLPAVWLSWPFPPPATGPLPLDGGFSLNPALFFPSIPNSLCQMRKVDLVVGRWRKASVDASSYGSGLAMTKIVQSQFQSCGSMPWGWQRKWSHQGKQESCAICPVGRSPPGEGGVLAPALHQGQQFWQDFVPVFPAAYIPLMFVVLAPNALGL